MSNFDDIIDRVLSSEGGYVNNPADPGGETNWGISKRSYPNVDIKTLTREGAKEIYKRDFYDPISMLNEDIIFQVLDFSVNSGTSVALRYLQSAAGAADDGHIGPATIDAVNAMPVAPLIFIYLSMRLKFMVKLRAWPTFGAGWANRIADNMLYAAKDLIA